VNSTAKKSAYALVAKLITEHLELARACEGAADGSKGPPLPPEVPHADTVVELERIVAAMKAAAS